MTCGIGSPSHPGPAGSTWKFFAGSIMAKPLLPDDLREFLKLLNLRKVEYMVIGGYAVGYYGYPRATADMDVWVAISTENANRVVAALREFDFSPDAVPPVLFLTGNRVVRLGVPPLRLEIITTISGVTFAECYPQRTRALLAGVDVSPISLNHLKINKAASGRPKAVDDLQTLDVSGKWAADRER